MYRPWLELALIHYPVLNRQGETIGSAITNLDLHDLARTARTFGVRRYWLVTPFVEQQQIAREIVSHWREGYGAESNPDRGEALGLIRVCACLEDAVSTINREPGTGQVTVVATCAREGVGQETLSFAVMRDQLKQGRPFLLLFGTGWGLAPEILAAADAVLPPIRGADAYNHLPVRAAAAIMLDRLMGDWRECPAR